MLIWLPVVVGDFIFDQVFGDTREFVLKKKRLLTYSITGCAAQPLGDEEKNFEICLKKATKLHYFCPVSPLLHHYYEV